MGLGAAWAPREAGVLTTELERFGRAVLVWGAFWDELWEPFWDGFWEGRSKGMQLELQGSCQGGTKCFGVTGQRFVYEA